jgi:3-methyladenine DNA glycosylase AlkD
MHTVNDVLHRLQELANPENLEGMARFGMDTEKRLGIPVPEMRKLAKEIGKNHPLAMELWKNGIPEARIVAGMIADPAQLTAEEMENWVRDFNSWDVCDQVCMNLFDKTELAWQKVREWSHRDEAFVKRAAFALIACLAWHQKDTEDQKFIELLPLTIEQATDPRNFVKKSVSWALRHIGKRNKALHREALRTAQQIKKIDAKSARWIASDVIRELENPKIKERLGLAS